MPLFDFKCNMCENEEERLVKDFYQLVDCSKCGAGMVAKVAAPAKTDSAWANGRTPDDNLKDIKKG